MGWLADTGHPLHTADGIQINVLELNHRPDAAVLSVWATHFRNHYCCDLKIDALRDGTGLSRRDYLLQLKFPDHAAAPGPSIRSGDFAEVLVADYVQFMLSFWVPRTRYDNRNIRNESTKGSDIIGLRFEQEGEQSRNDTLMVFESKAQLVGDTTTDVLQRAINDSAKDQLRIAESLNAIKQRYIDLDMNNEAAKISRFQDPEDRPYYRFYGAAAVLTTEAFEAHVLESSDATTHVGREQLVIIVIHGAQLMHLAHQLYTIAANEA